MTKLLRRDSHIVPFMDFESMPDSPTFYPVKSRFSQNSCIFSMVSDGKTLYVSGPTGVIKIWRIDLDMPEKLLKGHKDLVNNMIILKDGSLLSASDDASLIHWDTKACIGLAKYSGAQKSITCSAVAYDRGLASSFNSTSDYTFLGGSWDNMIYVWSPQKTSPKKVLNGHQAPVKSLITFEINGQLRLASGDNNGAIIVWDLKNFNIIHQIKAHEETVFSLQVYGNLLISSGQDKTVRAWTPRLEMEREFAREEEFVRKMFVFRKKYLIVLAGVKTIEMWDMQSNKMIEKRESKDIVSELTILDNNNVLVARRNEVNLLKYVNKSLSTLRMVHKFRMQQRYPPFVAKLIHEALQG